MGWLRTVGAVVAGFLAMGLAVAGSMAVAMALMGIRDVSAPPSTVFAGVLTVLSLICGIVGGSVCAWVAGRAHPRATLMLAIVVGALGVWEAVTAPPAPNDWHMWTVTAAGVIGVLAGSFFWTRGLKARSDAPRPM